MRNTDLLSNIWVKLGAMVKRRWTFHRYWLELSEWTSPTLWIGLAPVNY